MTPEQWLPILTKAMDERNKGVPSQEILGLKDLRNYVNGKAPLPEMGPNTRATWLAFQKKARTNYGGIAVTSHASRIRYRGVRVGSDDQSDASVAARRIARDNRLAAQISDAVRDMLSARVGYLLVAANSGQAVISAEKPELMYAEPDPVQPWRASAAVKVRRGETQDMARVWGGGAWQDFTRSHAAFRWYADSSSVQGGWQAVGDDPTPIDRVPVYILDRSDGMALVEPHVDVLDRINLGKLQRLSTMAIQAFKQRALKRDALADPLPEKDESGNPIDWTKIFEPAPGALWDLPAGFDIWESGTTDITQMLNAEKADARDFAGCTGTPVSMLQPDSQNQSATGAAATTQQQIDACELDIDRIQLAIAGAMKTALDVEGVALNDQTVEIDFEPPGAVTLAEKMDAVSKAVAAGVTLQMAQKTILGWSQEQIDEDERNRRREAGASSLSGILNRANGNASTTAPR